MNIIFAPMLMITHHLTDNFIAENNGTFPELDLTCSIDLYEHVTNCSNGTLIYEEFIDDIDLFTRVKIALEPIPNVILILPAEDLDRSVEIVNQRFSELLLREVGKIDPELLELNEYFVRHPANPSLAKTTIYTEGKAPPEINQDILNWIYEEGSGDYSVQYNQKRLL